MTPVLSRQRRISYGILAGSVVLGLLVWWLFTGEARLGEQLQRVASQYRQRQSASQIPLTALLEQQQAANQRLVEVVESLKEETGLKRLEPFIVPDNYREGAGFYLKRTYDLVRENLYQQSLNRRIDQYDRDLGFDLEGATVSPDMARENLVFLQLTARAALLALSAPDGFQSIQVTHGQPVVTGPGSRPPLLREYPIRLQLVGSLKDTLWLLHQLGSDRPEDDSWQRWVAFLVDIQEQNDLGRVVRPTDDQHAPLVVYGLQVDSSEADAVEQVSQLSVTIDLAGMLFIPEEQRAGTSRGGSRSRSAAASASRRRR
jgi:cell division protein FtsB